MLCNTNHRTTFETKCVSFKTCETTHQAQMLQHNYRNQSSANKSMTTQIVHTTPTQYLYTPKVNNKHVLSTCEGACASTHTHTHLRPACEHIGHSTRTCDNLQTHKIFHQITDIAVPSVFVVLVSVLVLIEREITSLCIADCVSHLHCLSDSNEHIASHCISHVRSHSNSHWNL